jgi:glycosyltransferase involved in cell wall biosynthesis
MVTRIVHISTGHGRLEPRVHLKECNSLAEAGYEVHFLVADGLGSERIGAVQIHDIGLAGGRFQRLLMRPWRMLTAARRMNARIFHFHDPELLLIALFLFKNNASVVYDSHEDVPRSLMSRDWVPNWLRPGLANLFEIFEGFVAKRMTAVVAATPHIAERFLKINRLTITINNYPLRSEIEDAVVTHGSSRKVCYLGGIARVRGIEEMVCAMEQVNGQLILAGPFENIETEQAVRKLPGWAKVDYRGMVSRTEVRDIMAEAQAGLIFFHPEPNHINAQPNKMFEYMSAGLPILASNFPMWRTLLDDSQVGIVADPLNPGDIARAISLLLDDPIMANNMGRRGREMVLQQYLWSSEEQKLLALYRQLIDNQELQDDY